MRKRIPRRAVFLVSLLIFFLGIHITALVQFGICTADAKPDFPLKVRWDGALISELMKTDLVAVKSADDCVDFTYNEGDPDKILLFLVFYGADVCDYFRLILNGHGKYMQIDFNNDTGKIEPESILFVSKTINISPKEGDVEWDTGSKEELEKFAWGLFIMTKKILEAGKKTAETPSTSGK